MNISAYIQVKILLFTLYYPALLSNCSKVTKNVVPYWLNFPQSPFFCYFNHALKHILTHYNHAHKGQPVHAIAQRLLCDHLSGMICWNMGSSSQWLSSLHMICRNTSGDWKPYGGDMHRVLNCDYSRWLLYTPNHTHRNL